MVEFNNINDLEAWLKGREHEEIIAVCARTALRLWPHYIDTVGSTFENSPQNFVLQIFRAVANAQTAALGSTRELKSAAANAANAIAHNGATDFASKSVLYAATAAANPANTTFAAAQALYQALHSVSEFTTLLGTSTAIVRATIYDRAITADATALENGMTAAQLAAAPLWPEGPPYWAMENWKSLKSALHAAPEEDWGVWTDWYEARLRGDTPNEALERARVLEITEEMWEQGPKVVNAEIRRLIEKHRPTREQLEDAVSPQPVIKDGKLDVQPNDTYDVPDDSEELADLPIRQRAIIRALLAAIYANRNISPALTVALEEYDTELLARGTRPMLGLLNDMHQIVRDEYRILNKEKFFESEGGLRRSFLTFSANHRTITEHFPLDVQREALIRETHVNLTSLNPSELRERIDAVSTATDDAFADGAVSEDYRRVMERLTQDMLRVSETPLTEIDTDPDHSILDPPQVLWWKRCVISMRGFIGKSVTRLAEGAGILAFLETERGIALMMKLQELLDFFWSAE